MRNFKSFLMEDNVPTFQGDIRIPDHWNDFSKLSKEYRKFTPGSKITGTFYSSGRSSLRSIEGGPSVVGVNFYCSHCSLLTSLEGGPSEVIGDFFCYKCSSITSLKGAPPTVGHHFDCSDCTSLTSLEGAPLTVGTEINLNGCRALTSLQGIGKQYFLSGKKIYLNRCTKLSSNMLGLILIKKLEYAYFDVNNEIEEIINRHNRDNKDIIDCKEELISAGYKEYAKL
jgi:hypothetical protein